MCNKNSFCSGCGSPVLGGKALCGACVLNARERGFSSLADFDDWHDLEVESWEANEFDHELAAEWGESVETVTRQGFQSRAFESEVGFGEVDLAFIAQEQAWREKIIAPSHLQGDLGA